MQCNTTTLHSLQQVILLQPATPRGSVTLALLHHCRLKAEHMTKPHAWHDTAQHSLTTHALAATPAATMDSSHAAARWRD
jgi:hypothetical protein